MWPTLILSTVNLDVLMMGSGAGNVADVMAPNPLTRAMKISSIVIGILVILTHVREARALLRQVNRFLLGFLLLAPASVIWSADQSATLARFVSYAAVVLISFAFCLVGWRRSRLQDVARPLFTLLLLASLVYIIMMPEEAIDFDKAGFHGLSGQKNPFGELAAFGTVLWMHGWIARENKLWKAIVGAALGWTCLWLSRSATSILATVFASWLMLMLLRTSPSMRRYIPYVVALFAFLVIAYALAVLQIVPGLATVLLGPIIAITGKDMTFSNRSVIWDIIKEHAQLHPILGTGYGAYWTGPVPTSPSYVFISRMYFWPSEGHNGYIDVVNDLGFVGLICLLGYLVVYLRQSLQLFKRDRPEGALYLALFFEQALNNLSESCWFSPMGTLPIVFMTLSTFALARGLQDQQSSRALRSAAKPIVARSFLAVRNRAGPRR